MGPPHGQLAEVSILTGISKGVHEELPWIMPPGLLIGGRRWW